MACGTPVIACNRGSMPELINEGENGFLVQDKAEAIKAVAKVKEIDRTCCRKTAEERFTADSMIEKYIHTYQKVLMGRKGENHRPWGYYSVLQDEKKYKAKKIVIYPGKRLSLQRHKKRAEHWYILHGRAKITFDTNQCTLIEGQSIDIPKGTIHRIENIGSDDLSFIEIQTGEYFGEDDIERIHDDFGRL